MMIGWGFITLTRKISEHSNISENDKMKQTPNDVDHSHIGP